MKLIAYQPEPRSSAASQTGRDVPVTRLAARPQRALAVDALRGLAILGMVLVAAEPLGVLPAWMYHAQQPPPGHVIDVSLPGLTWPDLVFPFFLFTLGVAIPLALTRRLERGAGYAAILRGVAARGALLVFFALFRQHFDGSLSGLEPQALAWVVGLVGFAVLFLIFVRLPAEWSLALRIVTRAVGWTAALLMFASIVFPDGSRFRPERIDIILLVLAYCAVFGTLIWLVTRQSLLSRLAVLAIIASSRVVGYDGGWLSSVWAFDPVPWLYKFSFFQFLCVVIPGTIVGDMLVRWQQPHPIDVSTGFHGRGWSTARFVCLAILLALSVPLVLAGIQGRYVFATTTAAALLCLGAFGLTWRPGTATESLIRQLVGWGTFWLLLGLLLDPFDGGTKKVPETFGWFFQGSGLAIFVMLVFMIVMDVLGKARWFQLLVDNGQNPMMAYVGYGMLVMPLLGLSTIQSAVDSREPSPALALGWSVLAMLLVALAVRFCSRRKLLWRS